MPSGVVPQYRLCDVPVGMVPHYQPCLLVWCHTIGHVFWSRPLQPTFILVECRWKKDGYKSGATYRGAITTDIR